MQLFSNLCFCADINIATGVIESREGAESNFYFVDKIRAIKGGGGGRTCFIRRTSEDEAVPSLFRSRF